ncbi:MAG: NAD(P)/FAD-dependent oxidoreductase [Lachnospiraceae bacterium]|nr:NAD(P)/FAD-dependent oxidoreductase [Lachnospiraceae bacterium]
MARYDIAIIGTGPAGLEAAITAKVRNKNVLLIGSRSLSSKVEKAHAVQNYLGLPAVTGEEMQNAFLKHIDEMGITITEDKITTVYAMGEFFALQGNGEMYEADSVILACGMSVAKPFPGEVEFLGSGVSYCATCDAALYRGKSAIVIGYSEKEEAEAKFLAEVADKVTYVQMYEGEGELGGNIEIVKGAKVLSIERNGAKMSLSLDCGKLEADGIFILRENVAPSQLVPGLSIEDNHVVVDRSLKTNLPGLFACGDITGAPYQYIKAAGEGNVAALSAVNYLADLKKEKEA